MSDRIIDSKPVLGIDEIIINARIHAAIISNRFFSVDISSRVSSLLSNPWLSGIFRLHIGGRRYSEDHLPGIIDHAQVLHGLFATGRDLKLFLTSSLSISCPS